MDPSAAGPNNAQHPPPPVQQWDDTLPHPEPGGGVLDGFAIDPDTKKALLSFITTGQASKDEIKQLYELCLSGLVNENNSTSGSAPTNKGRSPTMAQTSNDTMPALPPTPATTEDETPTGQDLLQAIDPPQDLKQFFINLHLSGKIPPADLEQLYNLSALAEAHQLSSLIHSSESSKAIPSGQTDDMDYAGFGDQATEQPPFLTQHDQGGRQMQQTSPLVDHDFFDLNGHPSPGFFGPFGMQEPNSQDQSPSYIAPTILDHRELQMPVQNQVVSPIHPMYAFYEPTVMPANSGQQNGLPSPVATRASSQSEGSSTPNAPQTNESTAEVACPILNTDGTTCGKRCGGAKRYRSMQEHIRRAHPEKYLQGLPANEESFQAMVQAGGIACTITDDNDVMCGERYSGNKRFRLIQEHVRERHPDNWVSDLPANEHSYNILMTKDDTVDCPLPRADGKTCTKHTFGEKRWRSLQEHIRRAHPKYYISGLHATEESIVRMVSQAGVTLAPPRRSKKPGSQKTKVSVQQRPQQRTNASEPAALTTEASALHEQVISAPPPDKAQQAFDSPFFPQQIQAATMQATLAPSALESNIFSPSSLATTFPSFQEPYQHMFGNSQLFLPQDLASIQHHGLGLNLAQSVATPTAQNLNQTLSPELFSGQAISSNQAKQKVYGDSYTQGLGQLAQPIPSFLPLQGMQPMSSLQHIQHSQPDAFLYSASSTVPEQQHPVSLSPVTPTSAKNVALSMPQSFARKRKAPQTNGLDNRAQNQPAKKTSLGKNPSAPSSAQQKGAPISLSTVPAVQSQLFADHDAGTTGLFNQSAPTKAQAGSCFQDLPVSTSLNLTPAKTQSRSNQMSPYFQSPTSPQLTEAGGTDTVNNIPDVKRQSRPGAGLVPSVPTPPLNNDRFGLIQEELADDPLRLLIATCLLVKSSGKRSIEIFRVLMKHYPTPQDLLAARHEDLEALIRPIGLGNEKARRIMNLVASWLKNTPTKANRYIVKDYPLPGDVKNVAGRVFGPEDAGGLNSHSAAATNAQDEPKTMIKADGFGTAWEVGHLISGPYMLDSWRIFCRDKLLGRAEDWKGKGAGTDFQPEWMRVLPKDKELRAYLYWMWMKEGFDWDADTGNKEPLSEEMRSAVNEGRVGYAETGKLIIVN